MSKQDILSDDEKCHTTRGYSQLPGKTIAILGDLEVEMYFFFYLKTGTCIKKIDLQVTISFLFHSLEIFNNFRVAQTGWAIIEI